MSIIEELAGFQTYVTGSPDSNLAILLIHDAFGYEAPNLRKLADKVASSGFFVVVPDLLYGDPADLGNPQFDPQAWLATHPSDKGCEDAKKVIAELRSRGFSAIGAAGFCWGGELLKNGVLQKQSLLWEKDMKGDEVSFFLFDQGWCW
ncbi:unnamed protein product [Linum tenue]|uniref:Dienelactone hydrolase domain-containing protein n=1 Tax=Linum tenue TaxID=586396 RepID=A0AAV0KKL4_9ROSI|nr:unnamed protein product [Linum tenue]